MRNFLEEIDICKINGIDKQKLPLWVYGTLRTGGRYQYYLVDCSHEVGDYEMRGTLKQMVSGDVFVCKEKPKGKKRQKVMGELHRVNLAGLWRIFHLENQSGTFPKAYDLDVSKIFDAATGKKGVALWFRRREEEAMPVQDYIKHKTLLEKLVKFIKDRGQNLGQNDIDAFLWKELKKRAKI